METQIKFLIDNYGIDDQRTQAWFAKRGEMITASEVTKCFVDATESARHDLIMSKLVAPKTNNGPPIGALIWGTRFEPVAKEIFCQTEKLTIKDLSCVRHPEHAFMGASPDGLLLSNNERNGRLIEIKCPISRVFTNETSVPPQYYAQMQMQMECTQLNECEYVEMGFKVTNYSEWAETEALKSCFAVSPTGDVNYKRIGDDLYEWQKVLPDDWQVLFWVLKNWRNKLVAKDTAWMTEHFPEIKSTWEEIMKHRENGTFPVLDKGILEL